MSQVLQAEKLLNHLVMARKYVLFYPAKSPTATQALDALAAKFNELFQGTLSGSPADAQPTDRFDLIVTRTSFLAGKDEVAPQNDVLRRFASDLYRLGIKQFSFTPGVTAADLRAFLSLVCEAQNELRTNGTLVKVWEELVLEHVAVESRDLLNLESRNLLNLLKQDEDSQPVDLLDYLEREATSSAGDGPALSRFFLELAEGAPELHQRLLNTLSDPNRLAATLTRLRGDQARADAEPGSDILGRVLRSFHDHMEGLPEETRATYFQTMAEAVLSTDVDTRRHLLNRTLASGIGRGGVEESILASLSGETVATVLTSYASFFNGTAETIAQYLGRFFPDAEMRNGVARQVSDKLGDSQDDRLRGVAEGLADESLLAREAAAPSAAATPRGDQAGTEEDAWARRLAPGTSDLAALTEKMRTACVEEEYETAAQLIMYLQCEHGVPLVKDNVFEVFEQALTSAFQGGRFDLVLYILEPLAAEMIQSPQSHRKVLVDRLFTVVASPECFSQIFRQLPRLNKDNPNFAHLIGVLRLLGEVAAERLFDRLTAEESRSMRMAILSLFLRLGGSGVSFLIRKAETPDWFPEWYVMRNVVFLLGRAASDAGLDVLDRLSSHPEIRVRKEVLASLVRIRGSRAEEMIVRFLKDPDPGLGALAADRLGEMGARQVLPILTEMLTADRKALQKDPERAVGFVSAIGNLGGQPEIALLRAFSPSSRFSWMRGSEELIRACDDAIAKITRRLETAGT